MIPLLLHDPFDSGLALRAGWVAMGVLALLGFGVLTARLSAQEAERVWFDLPAGEVIGMLQQFSEQSGRPIVVPTNLAQGARTRAVRGVFAPAAALKELLADTHLSANEDAATGAFAIVREATVLRERATKNAQALIVVGLAADAEQAQRLRAHARAASEAFARRGIPSEAIRVVATEMGGVTRGETILGAFRDAKQGTAESWVLLLGNMAPGRDGQPMFQVNGPRLSAEAFASAVETLPGRRLVVVAASRSGGFLAPLIGLSQVDAVAATAQSGELSDPRFAAMWIEALAAQPDADFAELARVAAKRVGTFYRDSKLAQTEHAQWIDRAEGRIVPVAP